MKTFAHNNQPSRPEVVLLIVVLLAAFRVCLLPALLFERCGESAVYAVLLGFGVDAVVTLSALRVASAGGVSNLDIPAPMRRVVSGLLALLCLFKTVLRTYETVQYCTGELFEQAAPYLLALVLLLTSAVLATRGPVGIARTGLIFVLVSVFLAVLALFFFGFEGYGDNLWGLLRPRGLGDGLLYSMSWVGDGVVLAFADTRGDRRVHGRYGYAWLTMGLLLLGLAAFYVNFVYCYGSAGRYVQFAFIRLLTNGDPEELGAVDWPVSLIWLMAVPLHLSAQFYAGGEGLRVAFSREGRGGHLWSLLALSFAAAAYRLLFADKDGFARVVGSAALSWTMVGFLAVCVLGTAVYAWRHRRQTT